MKMLNLIKIISLIFFLSPASYAVCPKDQVKFSFENVNITDAFAMLAEVSGLTVMIDKPVNYFEPMYFDCTPWQAVARELTSKYNLMLRFNDNVMYVSENYSLKEDLILIFTEWNGGGTLYVVNSSIKRKDHSIEFDYILDVLLAYEKPNSKRKYKSNKVHSVINCKDETFTFRGLESYSDRAGTGARVTKYYGTDRERRTSKIMKVSSTRDIYKYLCDV